MRRGTYSQSDNDSFLDALEIPALGSDIDLLNAASTPQTEHTLEETNSHNPEESTAKADSHYGTYEGAPAFMNIHRPAQSGRSPRGRTISQEYMNP